MTDHVPERDHHRVADVPTVLAASEVPASEVRWVYASSYYDGPRSGRVTVRGESLWAELVEECGYIVELDDDEGDDEHACGFYRRYRLIRLAPEAEAEETRRHALFEQMVGTHTGFVYDEFGNRRRASTFSAATHPDWHSFYDMANKWPEWKPDGELIGWFQT